MYNYCGKFVRSDPATRVLIMEINQITAITCNDTIEFTDDHNFANILEYTVNINISKISSSNNGYENIQSKRIKQVYSATLSNRWNINQGKSKNNVTRITQRGF